LPLKNHLFLKIFEGLLNIDQIQRLVSLSCGQIRMLVAEVTQPLYIVILIINPWHIHKREGFSQYSFVAIAYLILSRKYLC
jgi:hypothetical protein